MEFLGDFAGTDPNRPSLLELVAQEQLRDTLQPALKYILAVSRSSPLTRQANSVSGLRPTISSILNSDSKPLRRVLPGAYDYSRTPLSQNA